MWLKGGGSCQPEERVRSTLPSVTAAASAYRLQSPCHISALFYFQFFSHSQPSILLIAILREKNSRRWRDDFKNLKLNTILSPISTNKLNSAHFFLLGQKRRRPPFSTTIFMSSCEASPKSKILAR